MRNFSLTTALRGLLWTALLALCLGGCQKQPAEWKDVSLDALPGPVTEKLAEHDDIEWTKAQERTVDGRRTYRLSGTGASPGVNMLLSDSGKVLKEKPWDVVLVFVLLGFVVLAFFREWMPPDVVALGAMAVLLLTRVLSVDQIMEVFSNKAPITVAAMFVLSAGLERTGCIDVMGRFFQKIAGDTEIRVLLVLMILAAVLSAFVNNTPVVVVFLPIVLALARSTGLNASRLLIPMSFASILGGTCTLTGTSTNLIIDGVAQQNGQPAFSMFELTKLGVIYAVIGFVYLATIGRKLLPRRQTLDTQLGEPERRHFLTQVMVEEGSPLVGKTLVASLLKEFPEARILEVRRSGVVMQTPLDELRIKAQDRIRLTVHGVDFEDFKRTGGLRFQAHDGLGVTELESESLKLMEGIVGPRSGLIGKSLRELRFRQRFGVLIMAVHRQGIDLKRNLENVRLRFGDTLILEGAANGIRRLQEQEDFISLTEPPRREEIRRNKGWVAAGIVALFILGASLSSMPIAGLAILAAVGLMVTRCVRPQEAYEAVQWSIIFMIFGMLAVGKAMEISGGAEIIANGVVGVFGAKGALVTLSAIYLLSSTLTELISNNAVAALLTPIVIGIAASLDVDPRPFIVAIMFGCSASFATPIGYQTNTYVYGAGGYRFSDFPKVGLPLNLLLWVVATVMIPIFWPFK